MANWPSFTLAPRLRGGCLPFGEARGGVFALSELPHPCHVLLSRCKGNTFSFICKTQLHPKWKTPPASWCHFHHHPVASSNVNVDCRGLESTFVAPRGITRRVCCRWANMKWSRGRGVRSRAGDCRRWGRRSSRSSFRARATRHRRPGGCTMSRLHRW